MEEPPEPIASRLISQYVSLMSGICSAFSLW